MNSLEYEIEGYAVPTFSAEVEARNFFASANHDEVSKRKRQLEVLAASIDNTLKDKVRANYGLFLQVRLFIIYTSCHVFCNCGKNILFEGFSFVKIECYV
jgi:hypothetical protein